MAIVYFMSYCNSGIYNTIIARGTGGYIVVEKTGQIVLQQLSIVPTKHLCFVLLMTKFSTIYEVVNISYTLSFNMLSTLSECLYLFPNQTCSFKKTKTLALVLSKTIFSFSSSSGIKFLLVPSTFICDRQECQLCLEHCSVWKPLVYADSVYVREKL